jgi:hypothetical protein
MDKKFIKLLKNIKYPKKEEGWDVEGIIHGKTNDFYKFDLRPIKKFKEDDFGKVGFFNTKADKMVFALDKQWIILDIEELHNYIKSNNLKDLFINDLLKNLNWTIFVDK